MEMKVWVALIEAIGPFVILVTSIAMYLFVVQLTNDNTCEMLKQPYSSSINKGVVEFLAMCWWN